jgi:serine phosphatase RsbU (regulator of sigma subunit)/ABC-type amino acid transport substrate-binding protein
MRLIYFILFYSFLFNFYFFDKLFAQQEAELDGESNKNPLRVGLYESKPLTFRDDDGIFKGIYIDLIEYIAAKYKWKLKFFYEPSMEKSLEALKQGKIDLLLSVGFSEERAKFFDFTNEIVLTNWGEIFVHKDTNLRSIVNLDKMKVAVVKGNIYYDGSHGLRGTAEQFKINIEYVEVSTFREVLKLVKEKKVQAGLVSLLYGDMHKDEYHAKHTNIVFNPIEMRFAMKKNEPQNKEIIKIIDKEMKALIEDNNSIYHTSKNKWLNRTAGTVTYKWLLWGLAGIGGVAFLFLILSFILRKQVQKRTQELVIKNAEIQQLNEGLEQKVKQRTAEVLKQKEEIESKNIVLEHQKKELEIMNKHMRDSISYARNIQEAILPEERKIADYIQQYFMLSRPRDIVSGDFHWFAFNERNNQALISVADCTGHGVPGAFMSMLGKSALDYIMYEKKKDVPGEILSELQDNIYRALGTNAKDGMDIALCSFDFKNKKVYFAGGQSHLYMVRNGEVYVIKGDKFPIGGSVKYYSEKRNYTTHSIEFQPNDMFYMTSDGYPDQFGGADNVKYTTKRFRELLQNIDKLPLEEQKERILAEHLLWKGEQKQLDDILVIGVKCI